MLAMQGVLQHIPHDENGELTSVGSIYHVSRTCKPCLFWYKKSCVKGLKCRHCHIADHPGLKNKNKRIRPSKKTRMQMRGMAQAEAASETTASAPATGADRQQAAPTLEGAQHFGLASTLEGAALGLQLTPGSPVLFLSL